MSEGYNNMFQAKEVNLSLIKDDRLLIENFSYSLKPTDKTVIIGEEGNGKSTLLKFMYDDTLISSYASFTGNINRKGKYGYLPQFMSNQEQDEQQYLHTDSALPIIRESLFLNLLYNRKSRRYFLNNIGYVNIRIHYRSLIFKQ